MLTNRAIENGWKIAIVCKKYWGVFRNWNVISVFVSISGAHKMCANEDLKQDILSALTASYVISGKKDIEIFRFNRDGFPHIANYYIYTEI